MICYVMRACTYACVLFTDAILQAVIAIFQLLSSCSTQADDQGINYAVSEIQRSKPAGSIHKSNSITGQGGRLQLKGGCFR